jgi:hypothetical protein
MSRDFYSGAFFVLLLWLAWSLLPPPQPAAVVRDTTCTMTPCPPPLRSPEPHPRNFLLTTYNIERAFHSR